MGNGGECSGEATQWQTPQTDSFRSRGGDRKNEMGLDQEARNWGTPTSRDHKDAACAEADVETNGLLGRQTVRWEGQWRTPDCPATGGPRNHTTSIGDGHQITIADQAQNWPTPNTRDHHPQGPREDAKQRQTNLSDTVANWPTPTQNPTGNQSTRRENGREALRLTSQCLESRAKTFDTSHQDPTQPNGQMCWCGIHGCGLPSHRRKLNPLFEAWLMGWPFWWMTKEPMLCAWLEMELYLSRSRRLLSSLLGGRG